MKCSEFIIVLGVVTSMRPSMSLSALAEAASEFRIGCNIDKEKVGDSKCSRRVEVCTCQAMLRHFPVRAFSVGS